ncbi:MAG: Hpt domain-containing protein [Lachnospiraceae bacterium]|nr:Hpt domain-containing protein [Lachnospiraceae bacterium]
MKDTPNEVIPEMFEPLSQSGVDVQAGLKNSGSAASYIELLKVFLESIPERIKELERLLGEDDIRNYTIRVHALKSSARIIGAAEIGEDAQKLENAGKEEDRGYIKDHHEELMAKLSGLKEPLSKVISGGESRSEGSQVDAGFMDAVFEDIALAAKDMDLDKLDSIMEEMSAYSVPEESRELFEKVKDAVENYEYKSILSLLS